MTINKKVTLEVIKKERKYFEVKYLGQMNPFKLTIDRISENFYPGQIVENLMCEFEYRRNNYTGYGKTLATPVDEQSAHEKAALVVQAQIFYRARRKTNLQS